MKFNSIAFALLATAASSPIAVDAATITYTYTSTFTGTNDGNAFVTEATFTGIGDTNNMTTVAGGFPAVVLTSFIAESGGPFVISTPFDFGFNSAEGIVGFAVNGSNGFTFQSAALIGYNGVSNVTAATTPFYTNATFTTDRGDIVLTEQGFGTFSASVAAVPEPASWALMIGGLAMTGVAMRRRKIGLAA